MWRSIYHEYEVIENDILFIKKGANLTHQFFDDEFCAIFFFIPDDFIKTFLQKNPNLLDVSQKELSAQDAVLRVQSDALLESYRNSIISYLSISESPNRQILRLKFEEFAIELLFEGKTQAYL